MLGFLSNIKYGDPLLIGERWLCFFISSLVKTAASTDKMAGQVKVLASQL